MKKGRVVFTFIFAGISYTILSLTTSVYALALSIPQSVHTAINIVSAFFCASFIFSYFSGNMQHGKYFKVLYRMINGFFGVFFYIFLGSVLLSITLLCFSTLKEQLTLAIIGVSTALGIVGLIQARGVTVQKYTVTLKNAPTSWHGKRAALVSDTHFGLINHRKFSDKIVRKIQSLAPDFILHAGDFYDGPDNDLHAITASWAPLAARFPIFYAPGNHEQYGDYSAFIQSIKNAGITVLENALTLYDGVQIAGITYFGKQQVAEAASALQGLSTDTTIPLILINHPPTFHDEAVKIGTDLMVSGHTHRGQFWPLNFITRILYGTFFYGLHRYGTLTAITTSGVGTAGPPVRLFNTPELVVIEFSTDQERSIV